MSCSLSAVSRPSGLSVRRDRWLQRDHRPLANGPLHRRTLGVPMSGPSHRLRSWTPCAFRRLVLIAGFALLTLPALASVAFAHGVAEGDKGYIQEITGI